MATMDYRLTDCILDPPEGDSDAYHTETFIRLPRIFGCYDPPQDGVPDGPLPADISGFVTFG
jgi:hypothetical protein